MFNHVSVRSTIEGFELFRKLMRGNLLARRDLILESVMWSVFFDFATGFLVCGGSVCISKFCFPLTSFPDTYERRLEKLCG